VQIGETTMSTEGGDDPSLGEMLSKGAYKALTGIKSGIDTLVVDGGVAETVTVTNEVKLAAQYMTLFPDGPAINYVYDVAAHPPPSLEEALNNAKRFLMNHTAY